MNSETEEDRYRRISESLSGSCIVQLLPNFGFTREQLRECGYTNWNDCETISIDGKEYLLSWRRHKTELGREAESKARSIVDKVSEIVPRLGDEARVDIEVQLWPNKAPNYKIKIKIN